MEMYLSKRLIILLGIIVFALTISVTFGIMWMLNNPDPSSIDSDNDGFMDDTDVFPNDPDQHNDSDNDGIGDKLDKFPFDPAASRDSDDDGYPDEWNPGKTQEDSTSEPALILDDFPYDPSEYKDTDNDGIGDNSDVFPGDPSESRDDDGDGVGNAADHNPFVNLSFTFSLDSITLRKHVDILPWAQVYIKVFVDNTQIASWDNNGRNYLILKNRIKPIQQSFFYDIAETGSQNFTEIKIQVFDHDILRKDKQIDINQAMDTSSIILRVYHDTNTVVSNDINPGNEATVDYTVSLPTEIKPKVEKIDKTFQWRFMNELHKLSFEIPFHKYEWAMQSTVNRSPQLFGTETMADFVTTDDSVIESLADSLNDLAINQDYDAVETVNFVMNFVQQNIQYVEDNISKGYEEYWGYPIETLVDEQGDCEDTSVLFASIIENMDYDAVLLFYIVDEDIGHLATGVSGVEIPDGDSETYQGDSFYYCETTSVGFSIGEKPNDISDNAEKIIPVD